MARKRSGFYDTIEYIGPRPEKPKRQSYFGGWMVLVIAAASAFWFGRPLVSMVIAAQTGPSVQQVDLIIDSLAAAPDSGSHLAAAAIRHSREAIGFDPLYRVIDYPGGDGPADRGNAEDVIIRCYRKIGIDLQKEIHEDMEANFRRYPQLWAASGPDRNIDHRRVPNLQRFFQREGAERKVTRDASNYKPGDIVAWALSNGQTHIGIVVPSPAGKTEPPWVVHNLDSGIKWENALFDFQPIGHYRYPVEKPILASKKD